MLAGRWKGSDLIEDRLGKCDWSWSEGSLRLCQGTSEQQNKTPSPAHCFLLFSITDWHTGFCPDVAVGPCDPAHDGGLHVVGLLAVTLCLLFRNSSCFSKHTTSCRLFADVVKMLLIHVIVRSFHWPGEM